MMVRLRNKSVWLWLGLDSQINDSWQDIKQRVLHNCSDELIVLVGWAKHQCAQQDISISVGHTDALPNLHRLKV